MSFLRHNAGRAAFGLAVLALSAPLAGCFATQQDLDPIRSDVSVLERQFMEVQKEYAKSRYSEEGKTTLSEMGDRISDASTRLSALEKRMDAVEAQLGQTGKAPAAPAEAVPQPVAPEPIPSEPAVEVPGQTAEPGAAAPGQAAEPPPAAPKPTGEMQAASELLAQAKDAFDKGDYKASEAGLNKFLSAYPQDRQGDEARYMLGEVYFAGKDYQRAAAEYERVPADYPVADRVPDALYKAGVCQEMLGQASKAREDYTRVMDNYPYSEAAKSARERLDNLKQ